jgi:hypothetical protein
MLRTAALGVMFLGRGMSKQVVLTKMGVHQFTTAPSGYALSSNDIKIEDFLNASRSYSGFTLTSILIEKEAGLSKVWGQSRGTE